MRRRRFRLKKAAKILIFIVVVCALGAGVFWGVKSGLIKTKSEKKIDIVDVSKDYDSKDKERTKIHVNKNTSKTDVSNQTIKLSLDEWIGWKSVIDANGGLTTQPGSIYDRLGIDVEINVVNDATQSSNALIKGDLIAAGYTINRTAFLSNKFKEAGLEVVMPYITNYSNGGDGLIATNKYKTVESLVDAKIGVPQFSEAHSLVVWFVNQSDLSDEQKDTIIDNLIFFETPDEAAKAFFSGQIDVAATWQPYLTQAENTSNCHVLFSTANSTKLIMDGILFRKDWAEANADVVSKFIDGAIQAMDLYDTEFSAIREVMPMFAGMSNSDIADMTVDAALADWNSNKKTLKEEAPTVFYDMCMVWQSIGEVVNTSLGDGLFDTKYMDALADTYQTLTAGNAQLPTVIVTEDNKQQILDTEALLSKKTTVNFVPQTSKFMDNAEAAKALNEFVEIAKTLDGAIIQLEGNVASSHTTDAEYLLSEQRAETVKQYLVTQGIDARRILTVGNGGDKPVVSKPEAEMTSEDYLQNRRTDIFFKIVEQ